MLSSLSPQDWENLLPRLSRLAAAHPQSADLAFCYGAALFRSEFAKGEKQLWIGRKLSGEIGTTAADFRRAHSNWAVCMRRKNRIKRQLTNISKLSARIRSPILRTIGWGSSIAR